MLMRYLRVLLLAVVGVALVTPASAQRQVETYQGEWRADRPHGHGISRLPDGALYVGEYDQGRRQGHGLLRLPSGQIFIGEFDQDSMRGFGALWNADRGLQAVGEWNDGKMIKGADSASLVLIVAVCLMVLLAIFLWKRRHVQVIEPEAIVSTKPTLPDRRHRRLKLRARRVERAVARRRAFI